MSDIKYIALARKLEAFIRTSCPSGRLPGVFKLAARLNANHVTLRKAIHLLAAEGKLEIIPQAGTFVRTPQLRGREKYGVIGVVAVPLPPEKLERLCGELNRNHSGTGQRLISLSYNNIFAEEPELLLRFPVDGVIFFGSSITRSIADCLAAAGVPVISPLNKNFPELNQVGSDYLPAYAETLRRLLARGCRRIGYINFRRTGEFRNYTDEIREVFKRELGKFFDPELYCIYDEMEFYRRYGEEYRMQVVHHAREAWGRNPPDALIGCAPEIPLFQRFFKAVTVEFVPELNDSAADISVIENQPELLKQSFLRMQEILNGDRSIRRIAVPYVFYEHNERIKK